MVSDSEAEMSTNFGNSTTKLDSLEDIGLPELSVGWFTDIGDKFINHVIRWELVFYESVDFDFFKHAEFSFVKKLNNLGCISLFNISVEAYLS